MTMRGFSIVELLVGVAIIAIVLTLAVPSVMQIMRDGRIRTLAEEMHDGLQTARQEAIQRNATVRFDVDSSGWQVVIPASSTVLASRTRMNTESSYTTSATASSVSFSGSGRASTSSFRIDVSHSTTTCKASGGPNRCLRVTVQPGGAIRSCDPAVASDDPRSCA